MPRPDRVVFVAGTATEVGKTWTAAALAARLRAAGVAVAARKPVQSFDPGAGPTDADVLAAATGERPEQVCPRHRWYEMPLAPPMAAAALGRPPPALSDLLAELTWPTPAPAIGLVEGAGGPASPVADDADTAALAAALAPDLVVLVGHAGLGAINATRLSAGALPPPLVVFLNRHDAADPTHRANAAWLADRAALAVVTSVDALMATLSSA